MTAGIRLGMRVAFFAVAGTLVSCGGYSNDTSGVVQIQALPSLAFSPAVVSVSLGGTVTWVFGTVGDNVVFDVADGRPADITGTNMNTSVSRVFGTSGAFNFHSSIHPTMTGTVHVSGTAAPPPGYLTTP